MPPIDSRPRGAASLALALLLLGAWGSFGSADAQQARASLSSRGGTTGAEVEVRVTDLAPSTPVWVGFGGLGTPHELLGSAVTDTDGAFTLAVRIPSWAERDRTYLFFLAYADQRPWGFSDPFVVTGPDGAVRVAGEITHADGDCTLLQGFDETLWALTGATGTPAPGSEVVVSGTLSEPDGEAPPGSAPCGQGRPIQLTVREIQPR